MSVSAKQSKRTVAAAVFCVLAALAAGASPAIAKKKGKKVRNKVSVTQQVNLPVPDRVPALEGVLTSTIQIGKRGNKGMKVADVNLTLATTGLAPSSSDDLNGVLIAPNGAIALLFSGQFGADSQSSVSIGPLTLDDEAGRRQAQGMATNSIDLFSPWIGAATPDDSLTIFDSGRVVGTWTLVVTDTQEGETSILNFWRLDLVKRQPFATK